MTRGRLAGALVLAACGAGTQSRDAADARVQGAAVRELFFTREHARQLVVWVDAAERGPAFDVVGVPDAPADVGALAASIAAPVMPVGAAEFARLFRAHPDGWAAFYATHPGAPGLVEFARPSWSGDTLATVLIGRACGEHCVNAWRVTVRDGRVVATVPLRLAKL